MDSILDVKNHYFKLLKKDGTARLGELSLGHGRVETPVFMPCGTRGSVKTLDSADLEEIDFKIILSNTYHLFLRPGIDVIKKMGGLHKFISWPRNILTDSGGFQIFSLQKFRKITEEGIKFASHIDGSKHFLSPELAIEAQRDLGSDIVMAFDECPPHTYDKKTARKSMELTLRWAKRCKTVKLQDYQKIFGIVQGGMYADLREESAKRTVELGFDGYAVGGLSVGEQKPVMYEMLSHSLLHLPEDRPRYLMGVGDPVDIIEGVRQGIDMFDCVLPTRVARHGVLFTFQGKMHIKNKKYEYDESPIEENCPCPVCQRYSRALLRHFYKVGEPIAYRLNTIHNLYFMKRLMDKIREAIRNDSYQQFSQQFLADFTSNFHLG